MVNLKRPLILASASAARSRLLNNAGFNFVCESPEIDEEGVRASLINERTPPQRIAETLAELKAQRVCDRRPGCLVIGADQILHCEGIIYDKPNDLNDARADLLMLRGKLHTLMTSVVIVLDGGRLWHHNDLSTLTMRTFSDEYLEGYLQKTADSACESVGAYKLEALGVQLFENIEGDFFSILGLPLLPLIKFLRENGIAGQ